MKVYRLGVIVILIIGLSSLSHLNSLGYLTRFAQTNMQYSSFPDIYIDYNSTSCVQHLSYTLQLDLYEYNCFILLFTTSGDKTNSEGIKLTFSFEEVEVIFVIERLYQDHLGYNLTQFFSYPERFRGEMEVIITVKAQTSLWYETGSIRIFSYSTIEQIEPTIITEENTSFLIVPNTLRFMESAAKSERRTVTAVFNNSANFDHINLTLSFLANDFTAYKQHFELYINNQLQSSREFKENQLIIESFLLIIDSGVNYLTIDFVVEMCMGEIELSTICLAGKGIDYEDFLPENTYSYYEWGRGEFDHTFDLSSLQPSVSCSEQLLEMEIEYGYYSNVATAINYEINTGKEIVDSGEIIANGQSSTSLTLSVKSPLIRSDNILILRIQGNAEETGLFYLLNTSYINITPLPELQEQGSLKRMLVETENFSTTSSEPLILTFKDYCRVIPDYIHCNVSLSFSLINEFRSAVRQIDVLMKVGLLKVIDKQISYDKHVILYVNQTLYSNLYKITVTLSIYGDGLDITLTNLVYSLDTLIDDLENTNPFDNLGDHHNYPLSPVKPTIIYLEYGFLILFFGLIFSQRMVRRKEEGESIQNNERELTWFRRIIRFPKNWWLKVKESFFKTGLLPISIYYLVTKVFTLNRIVDEYTYLASSYHLNLFHSDIGKWGFYLFITCIFVSSFVVLSALFLISTSTFYKDLFIVAQFVGVVLFILYIPSSILLLLYLVSNGFGFELLHIISLLVFFLLIQVFLKYLRKSEQKQPNKIIKTFFQTNKNKTKKKNINQTINRTEKEDLSQEQYEEYKLKLMNYIISKITP